MFSFFRANQLITEWSMAWLNELSLDVVDVSIAAAGLVMLPMSLGSDEVCCLITVQLLGVVQQAPTLQRMRTLGRADARACD